MSTLGQKLQHVGIGLLVFATLWSIWFGLQVYIRGQAVMDEVTSRAIVASQLTAIASQHTIVLLPHWYRALYQWALLLTPFLVDIFSTLGAAVYSLPWEVKIGLTGGSGLIYLIVTFEIMRQILFFPVACLLWYLHHISFPANYKWIPSSALATGVALGLSLSAFRSHDNKRRKAWLMYWTVFPLYYLIHAWFVMPVAYGQVLEFYWNTMCVLLIWVQFVEGLKYAFLIHRLVDLGKWMG